MELKRASRTQVKIKMLIAGPSGSGKTYSALLMASGMVPWEKIAVIDTERGSADLYSDLGPYNTLTLEAPFTPERYIEAIETCVKNGMEFIIIDSITHEWDGVGGILQIHESMTGNSYTNWNKLTPRHSKFIDAILQSPVHIITTARSKQDYILTEKNGKQVPEKVGMKNITREGFDYEVTLAFELDMKHNATAAKDRTKLFIDKFNGPVTPDTGKILLAWCNSGTEPVRSKFDDYKDSINNAKTVDDLVKISNALMSEKSLSDYQMENLRKLYSNNPVFKANKDKLTAKKPADTQQQQGNNGSGKTSKVNIPSVGAATSYKKFAEQISETAEELSLALILEEIDKADGFTPRQLDALHKLVDSRKRIIKAKEAEASKTQGTEQKFKGTDSNNFLKKGTVSNGRKN